jgi:hypothetical protein
MNFPYTSRWCLFTVILHIWSELKDPRGWTAESQKLIWYWRTTPSKARDIVNDFSVVIINFCKDSALQMYTFVYIYYMNRLFFFALLSLLILGCAPGNTVRLSESTLKQEGGTAEPLDTLAAFRKRPGQPKTVKVKAYTRKDGTKVREYKRTPTNNKNGSGKNKR